MAGHFSISKRGAVCNGLEPYVVCVTAQTAIAARVASASERSPRSRTYEPASHANSRHGADSVA
jgi:hypothetical protein